VTPAAGQTPNRSTLGLTGLTINAMALIAPGAFLWLTFQIQALYGAPMAGSAMWFGIVGALLLCFATAISYAELSKLYPGAGSSYFFAEQAFLRQDEAYNSRGLPSSSTGWASHLYYWSTRAAWSASPPSSPGTCSASSTRTRSAAATTARSS